MLFAGSSCTCDLQELLKHSWLIGRNDSFLAQKNDGIVREESGRLCLCLLQGECALVNAAQLNGLIGSQDATTCVVAILACPVTSVVWAAHLDSTELGSHDMSYITSALQLMQQPQLFLVGGYCDTAGRGPALAQSFLQQLHSMEAHITVQLCCVGSANTAPDGSPRCCQLLLDPSTWQPHPWLVDDRGPEVTRRFVAQHCRHDPQCTLTPIWDRQQQQLVLPTFDATVSSWQLMSYERLLRLPDAQLLQYMSTSPDHEPDWFCQDMRDMLSWLIQAQDPHTPQSQSARTTTRYTCCGSRWLRVQAEGTCTPTGAATGTEADADAGVCAQQAAAATTSRLG